MPSAYRSIGFVGLGLIGGSLARKIREATPEVKVTAVARSADTIVTAKTMGMIDAGGTSLDALDPDVDLVFVCTPIKDIPATVTQLVSKFKHPLLITDVGSTKKEICEHAYGLGSFQLFIGGHPMAGSEKTGVGHADAGLFDGKTYILVPNPDPRYREFRSFIESLGFRVVELAAETHDRLMAYASHVPYLMSGLTVQATQTLSNTDRTLLKQVISSGFYDVTRVAESAPEWGADVCFYNSNEILNEITIIKNRLEALEFLIRTKDRDALKALFASVKTSREWLYLD